MAAASTPFPAALILAAGRGVRMKSRLAKVLHKVGGQTMMGRALETVRAAGVSRVGVVVGRQAAAVKAAVPHRLRKRIAFFYQNPLDGSGGAVRRAAGWLKTLPGDVFVTCADTPLIQVDTFRLLAQHHQTKKNAVSVLSAVVDAPRGYGRIVRSAAGAVQGIVEELDATPAERDIREINTGTYCFRARALAAVLGRLTNKNAKKEYYLTDVLPLLRAAGGRVGAVVCADPAEAAGVNSRADLAAAEGLLRARALPPVRVDKNVSIGAVAGTVKNGGAGKHPTVSDDHAGIGPNAALLSPVRVGCRVVAPAGARVSGAGSGSGGSAVARGGVRRKRAGKSLRKGAR